MQTYDLLNKRYANTIIQSGNKSNERLTKKEMVLQYKSTNKAIFLVVNYFFSVLSWIDYH